ncbi:hypothetical protein ACFWIB_18220 [Streptomyces sp. NPDC127051]|uniref:hypothetical protein n=1 Tax=Streptomyces sp. NPDC127051 TaxID=3347119 RepID=UPI003666D360
MSSTAHHPPAGTRTGGCDPGAIDELACVAAGIQRRAEVTQQHLPQLREFQVKFNSARTEYTKARLAAKTDLDEAAATLAKVREQIRCRVTHEQRHCLHQAVDKVFDEIRRCAGGWGCCVDDCGCDFDDTVGGEDTVATLSARIARYTADTLKAAACFTDLDGELTALPERAAKIKTDAAQLLADVCDAVLGKDVVRLYARLLVLLRRSAEAWRGFAGVCEFVDCLCKALLCVLKGWQAIAVLEGARAELLCKEETRKAACERKRKETVEEVMAEYTRLCPPCTAHPDGAEEEDPDEDRAADAA